MKGNISASSASIVVIENSSTLSTTPVNIKVKLGITQFKAATNGNGN